MFRGSLLLHVLGITALAGCALIDLRPFPIESCPASPNQLLGSAPNVWVQFPEPVVEAEVEPLLAVSAEGERLAGDLRWEANRLLFTPVTPFAPGLRHLLELKGTVPTAAGRSFNESIAIPFYVGTDAAAPLLTGVFPRNGEVVGVDAVISLTFSQPMDANSLRDAFALNPPTEVVVTWNAEGTVAAVAPALRWAAERLHSWSIATACRSRSGVAVARQWTGTFLVQLDESTPELLSTAPALVSGAIVTALPPGLSSLRFGDSILITFSEDVDLASLQGAFSLSPALAGTMRRVSPGLFVYVPSAAWLMGQDYVLAVSTTLTDLSGNPLRAPYRELFRTGIPLQSVTEIALSGDLAPGSGSITLPASQLDNPAPCLLAWVAKAMKPDGELELTATVRFARGYDAAHRPTIAGAIDLAGFYPTSVASPEVTQVSWLDDRTVTVSYLGFARSAIDPATGTGALYYKLTVPSGQGLTINQEGSFLATPVTLLLESGRS